MAVKKPAKDESISYKALREQLDEVLLKLQDPDCDVDEAVSLYEQALQLADKLEQRLEAAENRVEKIRLEFGSVGSA